MMKKYRVIAKHDLNTDRHTWTKGLDYEVVEKDGYFILASDQGSVNYFNEVKSAALEEFREVPTNDDPVGTQA
jgi:hypothetical protein